VRIFARSLILLLCLVASASFPSHAESTIDGYSGIRIEVSDVQRFWVALDKWKATGGGDSAKLQAILQTDYIDVGTPGLKAFIPGRIVSAHDLANEILSDPGYYSEVRSITERLARDENKLIAVCATMRQIYPHAQFPVIYLLIGRRSSGGTSTPAGLVIGAEMFSHRASSRLHPDDLVSLITHELVHYQQDANGRRLKETDSLLRIAMVEGAADYIAELLTGHDINEAVKPYADSHEQQLWKRFEADMNQPGPAGWLYNGDQVKSGVPPDLGYYEGYKICQAYIDSATDKRAALKILIPLLDERKILAQSHYGDRFRGAVGEPLAADPE
jgi:Predicted Zn-dependent protease (DUF2268)